MAAPTFGCIAPINYLLEADAVSSIINAAGSKILVISGEHAALDITDKLPAITAQSNTLEKLVVLGELRKETLALIKNQGIKVYTLAEHISKYPIDKLDFALNTNLDSVYAMFHTGGTTGTPKLVMQSHRNQLVDAWLISTIFNSSADDFTLTGLPLFHVNAAVGSLVGTFTVGASLLLAGINGYRSPGIIENLFEIVARFRITTFSGVPTIYAALMKLPTDHLDLSSLKFAACGAAPMPVDLFKAFQQKTGLKVIEGYGLTEGTAACCLNLPNGESKVGSIGHRFPYADLMIAELDIDNQFARECDTNEIGSILIKGPIVSLGYKQTDQNASLWVNDDAGIRWLNTGDLGRIDDDHYIWLTGRKKELIIRGGHNIDPKEIEETLAEHPAVLIAAAVGRPDSYSGEIPVAYASVSQPTSEKELLEYCQQHIGERAAIPKAIIIDNELPVTAVGKIFKPELVRREIAWIVNNELNDLGIEPDRYHCDVQKSAKNGFVAKLLLKTSSKSVLSKARERISAYTFKTDITQVDVET